MGRPLAAKLAALPADDRALLADYAAALHRAGYSAAVFPSKVHCARDPEGGGTSQLGNRLWAGWQAIELAILCPPLAFRG